MPCCGCASAECFQSAAAAAHTKALRNRGKTDIFTTHQSEVTRRQCVQLRCRLFSPISLAQSDEHQRRDCVQALSQDCERLALRTHPLPVRGSHGFSAVVCRRGNRVGSCVETWGRSMSMPFRDLTKYGYLAGSSSCSLTVANPNNHTVELVSGDQYWQYRQGHLMGMAAAHLCL